MIYENTKTFDFIVTKLKKNVTYTPCVLEASIIYNYINIYYMYEIIFNLLVFEFKNWSIVLSILNSLLIKCSVTTSLGSSKPKISVTLCKHELILASFKS